MKKLALLALLYLVRGIWMLKRLPDQWTMLVRW